MLVWDATIRDTAAPSYVYSSSIEVGRVAKRAAADKCNSSHSLAKRWCDKTIKFVQKLGDIINITTGEPKSKLYLKQRISISIQRTNAARVMGTFDSSAKLDEIFYILSINM